jgi:hypothetical protein
MRLSIRNALSDDPYGSPVSGYIRHMKSLSLDVCRYIGVVESPENPHKKFIRPEETAMTQRMSCPFAIHPLWSSGQPGCSNTIRDKKNEIFIDQVDTDLNTYLATFRKLRSASRMS